MPESPTLNIAALVQAARAACAAPGGVAAASRRTKLSRQFLASLSAGLTQGMRQSTLIAAHVALGVPFLSAPAPAAIAQTLSFT